ncbi:hypothetical protein [Trichocoleus sp. FACHB-46]|uniref:Phage protein n=1 Tax=Trichocoleus desertorum GB2-A4 TaxID=2933944 RepID=A0ABV0J6R8_9CYAN|nr:hypothetical protein [Trichocoleus sp. FACHB-46]
MPYQDINVTLSDADLKEIRQAIATIQQKLPFLITLNTTERKRLFKVGDKRLAFVQTSLNAAQGNRNILPTSFDLDGFSNDYRLATSLMEIEMLLNQMSEQVDDTLMAVGSEAMTSSLTVYDSVKTAAKKTPGLKGIAEQLGTLFRAIKSKPAKPAATDAIAASSQTLVVKAQSIVGKSVGFKPKVKLFKAQGCRLATNE